MTTATPGIATQYPPDGEVQALEWSVLLEGFYGIGRATRGEATHRGEEGRDESLIDVNRYKQEVDDTSRKQM